MVMGLLKLGILEKYPKCNYFIFILRATYFHGHHVSANCLEADKSNSVLYVGYETGKIGVIDLLKGQTKDLITAHEGSVNAMGINLTNTNLFTVGSDGVLNIWQ
jgi:hypothetical protein